MSSSRYERVPQLDDSISLNTVHASDFDIPSTPEVTAADSSYNYNSGVPTSPPPSFRSRTSSIAAPSFPAINTFHSAPLSNQGRGGVNGNASGSGTGFGNSDFSTVMLTPGSSERTVVGGSGSDAGDEGSEMLIRAMSKRIERLEESIGRLLMEKSSPPASHGGMEGHSSRCCSTFVMSDNPNDPENYLRAGDCCVRITSRNSTSEKLAVLRIKIFFLLFAMIILWTVLLKALDVKAKGKAPDQGH